MTPPKRRKQPFPSQRYGAAHRAMRQRLAPAVATGTVRCARCNELIGTDQEWQLDHRDDGRGWLGPSHKACNARAGWQKMVNSNSDASVQKEQAYRWSQRWFDDPPIGTTANLGDGMVEVHLGGGAWQSIVISASL